MIEMWRLRHGPITMPEARVEPMIARSGNGVMAKKPGRPRKPGGEGAQVRIERDLAMMARAVANHRGMQLNDYLSGLLRPTITKDYRRTLQELEAETEGSKG
jgi:hypothetical protein